MPWCHCSGAAERLAVRTPPAYRAYIGYWKGDSLATDVSAVLLQRFERLRGLEIEALGAGSLWCQRFQASDLKLSEPKIWIWVLWVKGCSLFLSSQAMREIASLPTTTVRLVFKASCQQDPNHVAASKKWGSWRPYNKTPTTWGLYQSPSLLETNAVQ